MEEHEADCLCDVQEPLRLPLLIGEAPTQTGTYPFDADTYSGRRLARLAGRPRSPFEADNLFPYTLTGPWSAPKAREAADSVRADRPGRNLILAGRKVADAFGVPHQILTWYEKDGRLVAVLPHPSGLNRWYNDPANFHRAELFVRRAMRRSYTPRRIR